MADFLKLSKEPPRLAPPGHPGDRGCVLCGHVASPDEVAEYVIDERDRYWHAECASKALADIMRRNEDRLHIERGHPDRFGDPFYRWTFAHPPKRLSTTRDYVDSIEARIRRGEEP